MSDVSISAVKQTLIVDKSSLILDDLPLANARGLIVNNRGYSARAFKLIGCRFPTQTPNEPYYNETQNQLQTELLGKAVYITYVAGNNVINEKIELEHEQTYEWVFGDIEIGDKVVASESGRYYPSINASDKRTYYIYNGEIYFLTKTITPIESGGSSIKYVAEKQSLDINTNDISNLKNVDISLSLDTAGVVSDGSVNKERLLLEQPTLRKTITQYLNVNGRLSILHYTENIPGNTSSVLHVYVHTYHYV